MKGSQQRLVRITEAADRGLDQRAPLLLVLHGSAHLLRPALLRDVLVCRNKTAAWQRQILHKHNTTVRCRHVERGVLPSPQALDDLSAIVVDITREQASLATVLDHVAQSRTRLHDLGRQSIHLEATRVAHEHAALRTYMHKPCDMLSTASARRRFCTAVTRCQMSAKPKVARPMAKMSIVTAGNPAGQPGIRASQMHKIPRSLLLAACNIVNDVGPGSGARLTGSQG
jgi:hypothetical protein